MKLIGDIREGFQQHLPYVEALLQTASDRPLEDLENAIYVAKLQRMAKRLQAAGFQALASKHEVQFNLVLVFHPSGNPPGEWATLEECRRLLDTVANLPPAAAFERWRGKIEPLHTPTYTRQDAIRDTLEARAALRRRFEAGEMSAADHALEYRATSFMDL